MRVVLTGGGSAGHFVPLGPIIEALRQQFTTAQPSLPRWLDRQHLELYFVGVLTGGARSFLHDYAVPTYGIVAGKLRRYASAMTIVDLVFKVPLGCLGALWRLFWIMPDVVVSKGGYGSVPVVLAARFYRIPVLLHESDTVPGLANRFVARCASAIAVGFESARLTWSGRYAKRIFVTGIPVRRDLEHFARAEARAFFQISPQDKVLLVLGGSQGAEALNETLLKILPALVADMHVLHVTGERHARAVQVVAGELLAHSSRRTAYHLFPYLRDELGRALVAADVVVSRAGATVLAELARLRKVTLLVPLPAPPAAHDHQWKNAELFERYGAARVLAASNVTPALLEQNIRELFTDASMRERLQQGMAAMDRPGAAEAVATLVFCLALRVPPTLTP